MTRSITPSLVLRARTDACFDLPRWRFGLVRHRLGLVSLPRLPGSLHRLREFSPADPECFSPPPECSFPGPELCSMRPGMEHLGPGIVLQRPGIVLRRPQVLSLRPKAPLPRGQVLRSRRPDPPCNASRAVSSRFRACTRSPDAEEFAGANLETRLGPFRSDDPGAWRGLRADGAMQHALATRQHVPRADVYGASVREQVFRSP